MQTFFRPGRLVALVAGLACLATALVGCTPSYTVVLANVNVTVPCGGGTTLAATWAIPQGTNPDGLIWLQHGFARDKNKVQDLQKRYAARGFVVIAPSLGSFGSCTINEAPMHQAIADALAGSTAPSSALQVSYDAARSAAGLPAATLPSRFALSGHSAGGALVTVVAGRVMANPSATVRARLRGVMLLDPVENTAGGMAANLPSLATIKVLTISGADSSCNSNGSGTDVLLPRRTGFAGVRLPSGCHCDAEADSTDALCTLLCGTPTQANKDALRQLAADWISNMIRGTTTADAYPGGLYYEQQKTAGTITTLTGTA